MMDQTIRSFKDNACENESLKDINTDINSCDQGNERQTTLTIKGVSWPMSKDATPWAFEE